MEAIILAGGTGTRLRSIVSEVPKPLAPVQGRPFLEWQLGELERQGVRRVILSVGYLAEKIIAHFGTRHGGLEIEYVKEDQPLGTGGAVRLALRKVQSPLCLILNGDSFFEIDHHSLEREHTASGAVFTLTLKPLDQRGRYGGVEVENGRVKSFVEKSAKDIGPGLINTGVYLATVDFLKETRLPERFSLERDFLVPFCAHHHFHGFISNGFFIDIGVPEDYTNAQLSTFFRSLSSMPALG